MTRQRREGGKVSERGGHRGLLMDRFAADFAPTRLPGSPQEILDRITGVFFGVELILQEFSVDALFTVTLSAMLADVTARPFLGSGLFLSGFPSGIVPHHPRNYLLVALLAVARAASIRRPPVAVILAALAPGPAACQRAGPPRRPAVRPRARRSRPGRPAARPRAHPSRPESPGRTVSRRVRWGSSCTGDHPGRGPVRRPRR